MACSRWAQEIALCTCASTPVGLNFLAAGVWVYGDNGDFFGGKALAQDPFFVVKANVIAIAYQIAWN